MKICKKCNAKIEDNQNFCPVCGTPAERKAPQQSNGKKGKKQSKAAVIIAAVAIIIVAAGGIMAKLFLLPEIEKSNTYKEAVACYSTKQYEQAQKIFETLGDYKDSKQKAEDSCLGRAEQFLSDGDYKNAREIVKQLGDSDSAKKMENQCDYEEAEGFVKQEEYAKADVLYTKLSEKGYKDADALEKEVRPKAAEQLYMEKIESTFSKRDPYDWRSYSFLDVNEDDIPELFFIGEPGIFSYQNGELIKIGQIDSAFYCDISYCKKTKMLRAERYSDTNSGIYKFYKYTDNKFIEYSYEESREFSSNNAIIHYYKEKGKKIKRMNDKEYYDMVSKLTDDTTETLGWLEYGGDGELHYYCTCAL